MLVVVSYDVKTEDKKGQRRLRHIARAVEDFGQRVQYSVFECDVNPAQWEKLKDKLLNTYNPEEDSLRFYFLGKNWRKRLEHYGQKEITAIDESLII